MAAQATLERPAFEGIYEMTEVADYLRVTMPRIPGNPQIMYSSKLIRWIRYGLADPSLVRVSGHELLVSGHELLITFEDLISMRVISFMRYFGYGFKDIHRAHTWLKKTTGYFRPFATERLWIEDLGAMHIYAEIEDLLAVANRGGQLAFRALVQERLVKVHNMTFNERGVASSWMPEEGIRVDPKIQFGRPCIAGTRTPTADIVGMIEAGDSEEFLASSYGLKLTQIESAKAWEGKLAIKKVSQ